MVTRQPRLMSNVLRHLLGVSIPCVKQPSCVMTDARETGFFNAASSERFLAISE